MNSAGAASIDTDTPEPTDTPEAGDRSPFALGLLLRRAHERSAGALLETLRPLGLELRHAAVLEALAVYGTLNQRDLAARVGSDKASMVRVIDELEAAGLAARRPVPGDRRVRAVELTAPGRETFDAAHEAARAVAADLVSRLRPGEADQLADLLTRFAQPSDDEN